MSDAAVPEAPATGRIAQMRQAYRIAKRVDRFIGLKMLGVFLLVGGVVFGLFQLMVWWWLALPLGILSGFLATLIFFGRRAEAAAYAQVEGQLGAGGSALTMLRRGWSVKSAVAFTKQQDVVHRVIGRPGVVLVGEGSHTRVKNLLASEAKKHSRIAEGIPVHQIIVGRGENEVPVPKLVKHVRKLPKGATPGEVTEMLSRVRALDAMRPTSPMPRGPMPTSAKAARRMMQGR